jgi:predicted MFS family arabinose efflux permease
MAAPVAGHLSDRFSARIVNGCSLGLMIFSFLLMLLADRSLLCLVAGVFLMDAGAQANQISNQTRIYGLAPELRSRITSVYMVVYFIGGGIGSALSSRVWGAWRWPGVCFLGALMAGLGLVVLFTGTNRAKAAAVAAPRPATTD